MSFSDLPCLSTCYIFCHTMHSPLFFTNLHRHILKHPVISHCSHIPYNISYSHTTVKCTNTSQIQQELITSLTRTTHQFTFKLHSNHSHKYTIATKHFTQFISTESNPFTQAYTLLHIYTSTIFNILPTSQVLYL